MIKFRNIEGIYIPFSGITEGAANGDAADTPQHAPTVDGRKVARLVFPFDCEVAGLVVEVAAAPVKGTAGEDYIEYLVCKRGTAFGAADPVVTHGSGVEVSERLYFINTILTPDFLATINTMLSAKGNGKIVPAGTDILVMYNFGGTPGTATKSQFFLRGLVVNKKPNLANALEKNVF